MALSTGTKRSAVILQMADAITAGKSAGAFLKEMQAKGLGYRRTTFLADWRSEGNIEKKTGLLKYVRKDYLPSPALYADVSYKLSREYFYKIKVHSRLRPGEPIETRFANIVNDRPMTPGELETEVRGLWVGMYRGVREMVVKIEPVLAMKRV